MADKKITDLTSAGTLDGTENVYVVKSGNSRKTTTQNIADLSAASLSELTDTNISSPAEAEYIKYDGTAGEWINAALDGDTVSIDFTPSNYTPDATPAEADDVDDLAAHLKGIDTAIGNATVSEDSLDGDVIPITWNPSNYTPDAGITEASDVDDLAAHLKGIDTALVSAGGGGSTTTPYVSTQTYTLSDVDGSGNLNIDLSDADTVEIMVSSISSDTSERPTIQMASGGGATVETGSVYNYLFLNSGSENADTRTNTNVIYGSTNSTGDHPGIIRVTGATKTDKTGIFWFSGTPSASGASLRQAIVDTTTAYDTLQFQLGTGSFDAVDITVYKYASVDVYTTDGIQIDNYLAADLETGDAALTIDMSGYDICEIIVNSLSSTASETVLARVSSDEGATLESGSVYKLMNISDTTYANTDTQLYFGSAASTGSHYGHVKFVGANEANYTQFSSTSGTADENRSRVLNGVIDSLSQYDAVQFFVESGTFDDVDVTVYRYNVASNVTGAIDGDKVSIDWNPSNYTPDATPTEADDVDDLAAHLKGIDDAFGNVSSGAGLFKGENGTTGDTVNGAGDIFRINEKTLNTDTTIASTENASCTGPLTVATGVTLTIEPGGVLKII